MSFHHVAVATKDPEATHAFYTEAMGFTLVKCVVAATENPGGWAKHLFYDTGDGELMAFWDLHDPMIGDFDPALSRGMGLPTFVNHIAFTATDRDDLDARRVLWQETGNDVAEIDHGWCRSIYTMDPNATMVEWCVYTTGLDESDRAEAERLLRDPSPALEDPPPDPIIHPARRPAAV